MSFYAAGEIQVEDLEIVPESEEVFRSEQVHNVKKYEEISRLLLELAVADSRTRKLEGERVGLQSEVYKWQYHALEMEQKTRDLRAQLALFETTEPRLGESQHSFIDEMEWIKTEVQQMRKELLLTVSERSEAKSRIQQLIDELNLRLEESHCYEFKIKKLEAEKLQLRLRLGKFEVDILDSIAETEELSSSEFQDSDACTHQSQDTVYLLEFTELDSYSSEHSSEDDREPGAMDSSIGCLIAVERAESSDESAAYCCHSFEDLSEMPSPPSTVTLVSASMSASLSLSPQSQSDCEIVRMDAMLPQSETLLIASSDETAFVEDRVTALKQRLKRTQEQVHTLEARLSKRRGVTQRSVSKTAKLTYV